MATRTVSLFITFVILNIQPSFCEMTSQIYRKFETPEHHYQEIDTTVIKIELSKEARASFYFNDEFGDNLPPFFLSHEDKVKTLYIKTPTLLIDSYHQIGFLVYPGEHLTLHVDQDGLPEFTSSTNSTRNNELHFFVDYYIAN